MASRAICATLQKLPELQQAPVVAGFWPLADETDIRPALAALYAHGKEIALPVVTGSGLVFRLWSPDCRMEKRGFGLLEPSDGNRQVFPEALIVPLVAYDRAGGRLGYGKGYYDRAIASLSEKQTIMTIGVAFAIQEVKSIPLEPHDRSLDMIVTDAGIIRSPR